MLDITENSQNNQNGTEEDLLTAKPKENIIKEKNEESDEKEDIKIFNNDSINENKEKDGKEEKNEP